MNKIFRNIDKYEVISSEIIGAEVSDDIAFTKKAMDEILNFFEKNVSEDNSASGNKNRIIRLLVTPIKNYAKSYSIIANPIINLEDRTFNLRKLTIAIDNKSLFYFMGIIIDFVDNQAGKGFLFINNYDGNAVIPSEQTTKEMPHGLLSNKIFC